MDSDESWLMELKLSGMIENLKHEMSGGFEYRIHDLTVKLETYIRLNENLKEQLNQTDQYAHYLMGKLEEVYVKVHTHDEFIGTVKNVEFELLEEVKERKNGR